MSQLHDNNEDFDYVQPRIMKCRRCKKHMRTFDFNPKLCDNCKADVKHIEYVKQVCKEYYKRGFYG